MDFRTRRGPLWGLVDAVGYRRAPIVGRSFGRARGVPWRNLLHLLSLLEVHFDDWSWSFWMRFVSFLLEALLALDEILNEVARVFLVEHLLDDLICGLLLLMLMLCFHLILVLWPQHTTDTLGDANRLAQWTFWLWRVPGLILWSARRFISRRWTFMYLWRAKSVLMLPGCIPVA